MRIDLSRLLLALVLYFVGANVVLYLTRPLLLGFTPFWGTFQFFSVVPVSFALAAGVAILVTRRRPRRVRPGPAVALLLASSVTFFQLRRSAGYDVIVVDEHTTLYSYQRLSTGSVLARRLAQDLAAEIDDLAAAFGVEERSPLLVVVFPSRPAFLKHIGADDSYSGLFDPVTSRIYVAIQDWHSFLRHELVHYFQREVARRSPWQLALYVVKVRPGPIKRESLAYSLAPQALKAVGWRAIDYVRAFNAADAALGQEIVSQEAKGRPTPTVSPGAIYSARILLDTDGLYSARNDAEAVRLFYRTSTPAVREAIDLTRHPRDLASEREIRFEFAEVFARLDAPSGSFVHKGRFADATEHLPPSDRRRLAQWNREHRSRLGERVWWEMVLDTLGTAQSTSEPGEILEAVREARNQSLDTETDIARVRRDLQRLFRRSVDEQYWALAAHIYVHVLELDYFVGQVSSLERPLALSAEYNLFQRQYVDYLEAKAAVPLP